MTACRAVITAGGYKLPCSGTNSTTQLCCLRNDRAKLPYQWAELPEECANSTIGSQALQPLPANSTTHSWCLHSGRAKLPEEWANTTIGSWTLEAPPVNSTTRSWCLRSGRAKLPDQWAEFPEEWANTTIGSWTLQAPLVNATDGWWSLPIALAYSTIRQWCVRTGAVHVATQWRSVQCPLKDLLYGFSKPTAGRRYWRRRQIALQVEITVYFHYGKGDTEAPAGQTSGQPPQ